MYDTDKANRPGFAEELLFSISDEEVCDMRNSVNIIDMAESARERIYASIGANLVFKQ